MTSTSLTSELEAINVLLQAADEAPVTSLELTGLYPLDQAKTVLSETSRAVQSRGWFFNTEEDYTVPLASDSTATLPANVLRFDAEAMTDMAVVLRGLKLYDKKAHSYTLLRPIKGTVVLLLAWDELPQAARQFITVRAAKTMQGRTSVAESTYKYTQADLDEAERALTDAEAAEGDYNMLRDSWSVGSVLFGRDML